jgi:hypothetical protein
MPGDEAGFFKITLSRFSKDCRVEYMGHDITHLVHEVKAHAKVGQETEMTLTLRAGLDVGVSLGPENVLFKENQ